MKNENLKSKLKAELAKSLKEDLADASGNLDVLNPDTLENISGGAISELESAGCAGFSCGAYDNCGLK